jgi:hypothetical protein
MNSRKCQGLWSDGFVSLVRLIPMKKTKEADPAKGPPLRRGL